MKTTQSSLRRALRRALLTVAPTAALLSGCAAGPDFEPPTLETPAAFTGVDSARIPAISSRPVAEAADCTTWWKAFGDPELESLIDRALALNLDVDAATARIREARANRIVAGAARLPELGMNASAVRSGNAVNTGSGKVDVARSQFRAGFDASWEIDIFGRIDRQVEAADAALTSTIEDRRDVLVSLAAEVGTTYIALRSQQESLAIARSNLATERDTLSLTQERLEAGFVGELDVSNAEAQVASTTSRIPTLEASVLGSIYALGVLLGREPAALLGELTSPERMPAIPTTIPVGLPSELLRRRPDIRRAAAELHAATAQIGVAMADLYPRFSLTGSAGNSGINLGSLVDFANRFWSLGPSISWSIADAGRIDATIEARRAAADQALATWRHTVLVALRDVETALVNFTREQERRQALSHSVESNRHSVDLASQLYTAGKTDFLNVLSAQRLLLESETSLVDSDRAVATDLIALYKALGGGWTDDDTAPPATDAPR